MDGHEPPVRLFSSSGAGTARLQLGRRRPPQGKVAGRQVTNRSITSRDTLTEPTNHARSHCSLRSVWMATLLGAALALTLFVFRHAVAKFFTSDPLVLLFISGETVCVMCPTSSQAKTD